MNITNDIELGNGDDGKVSSSSSSSSTNHRSQNLSQQTNQMLSNYQDFLSDMAKEDGLDMSGDSYEEDDCSDANTNTPPQSSSSNSNTNNGNGHTNTNTNTKKHHHYSNSPPKTKEGIAHRSWTRADNAYTYTNNDQQQHQDLYDQSFDSFAPPVNNMNMSTIEEDASLAGSYMTSSRDWPDFMMGGQHSWETEDDYHEHQKYHRLRCYQLCQHYKRILILLLSIIGLLAISIGLSISEKRKHNAAQQQLQLQLQLQLQQQANNEYAKQYTTDLDNIDIDIDTDTTSSSSLTSDASDLYNRPPFMEEDDPSNLVLVLGEEEEETTTTTKNVLLNGTIDTTTTKGLHPKWFTASTTTSSSSNNNSNNNDAVWTGSNYQDAKTFCKTQSVVSTTTSSSLQYYVCPYKAYCPGGPGLPPYNGIQGIPQPQAAEAEAELWAPMYDGQELWVGVGSLNTCLQRGVLQMEERSAVKYVLCCREEEEEEDSAFGAVEESESEESEDFLDEGELLLLQQQEQEEDDNQSNNMNAKPSNVLELEGHTGQGKDNTAESMSSLVGSSETQPSTSKPSATIQQQQQQQPQQKTNANAWTPKTEPPIVQQQPIPTNYNTNNGSGGGSGSGGVQQLTHNEQAALTYMNPLWYGRADGYNGTTHAEAVDFCKSIGGDGDGDNGGDNNHRQLCLAEAYCPNGSPSVGANHPKPLFLQMKAFEGEQWAPISFNANSWVLIGTMNGRVDSTCQLYENIHGGQQPLWGFDGSHVDRKEHILCCLVEGTMSEELLAKNQVEEDGEGRSSSD